MTERRFAISLDGKAPIAQSGVFTNREDAVATAISLRERAKEEYGMEPNYVVIYRDVTTTYTDWVEVE